MLLRVVGRALSLRDAALPRAASVLRQRRCSPHSAIRAASSLASTEALNAELPELPRHSLNAPPIVYHPAYSAPRLAPGHRFPMQVFGAIHELLLEEGMVAGPQVHAPVRLPSRRALKLVHTEEYVDAFSDGLLDDARVRRIGFGAVAREPILIERTLAEVAGTLLTALLALEHGLACNTAGGTHHAFPAHGAGFCLINDMAITAELLLASGRCQRIAIVDLDVHQGDGTAACFTGRADVFTLSVHAASNYPARKQQSTLDVPLPDGTDDGAYLAAVAGVLPGVLSSFRPDLVIYDAGVDVHVEDDLGRLAVTDEGLRRRELLVLDTCLGAGVPVAGLVGGGYAPDLRVLARRHTHLHAAAAQMWEEHGL